ncbi:FemAB family PEP-CTERM system-associated protein (plasmid) [Photobacterium sp. GJ3]|uniref:FemAB family XrtA/PEP-CTERM system-associated protein n=1 Tax=Photobacterium sp. GJ3 TaxID=2829502 RepID=UPI001B8D872A|nr:FemAB family XrtA/PEP-CTERM system-associated protein [Photobacterium sp. GJ3]QUJ69307.1 FemAB family PEP-CTERM system-associated protein [Photobacterium sp. GJ3]
MKQDLTIRALTRKAHNLWDHYVDSHQHGSFFHLTGWIHVIQDVFGHQPHYLFAQQGDQIVGVLPLFEQKSLLFGHALISTPFCVYGGALADQDDIRRELENAAYDLACELNVDYIELRDSHEHPCESPWFRHCHHATFKNTLALPAEDLLSGIKRKQRAVIRHAQKNNLSWEAKDNPALCFELYAESVRNLGTPVFPPALFQTLKDTFGSSCETLVVRDVHGQPVSGVLSFYYKNQVLPYYGGGTQAARDLKSNDFMYYQLMLLAKERGAELFDFGRSKINSGAYHYKKHWGMEEQPLHYRMALVRAKRPPNLSPNNPKYRYFIRAWQNLPMGLSKQIGPMLSKYLG